MEINEGTEIAIYNSGKLIGIKKVERVTATQAILTNGTKLRRNNLSEVGGETYSHASYELVTPAIRAEFELKRSRNVVLKRIEALNEAVKNGDMEFITKVYQSIKEFVPSTPAKQ